MCVKSVKVTYLICLIDSNLWKIEAVFSPFKIIADSQSYIIKTKHCVVVPDLFIPTNLLLIPQL